MTARSFALLADFLAKLCTQASELLLGRERRDGGTEFFPRREWRDGGTEFFLGRERGDGVRDGGTEFFLGRKGWQKLLYPRKPAIQIFEMCRDHVVVHQSHLPKDGWLAGRDLSIVQATQWPYRHD